MSADEHNDHPGGYEKQDASVKAVALTTLVSLLMLGLASVALWDFYVSTRERVVFEQELKPTSQQLIELHKLEDSVLTTYQFVDSTTGIYRIPINRAIELMAAESAGTVRR